jgi:hypothetical protein
MSLRYLALSPVNRFNAALLKWALHLDLQKKEYVSFHRHASLNSDKLLQLNRWLSLGEPQQVPHTEAFIIPLCVRGFPVGGLRVSPNLKDSSVFDPILGHWIEREDERHLRITCASLSPMLEATLWCAMEGLGVFIMDGPKIGTLSPLAPAFVGAGNARFARYIEMQRQEPD